MEKLGLQGYGLGLNREEETMRKLSAEDSEGVKKKNVLCVEEPKGQFIKTSQGLG